MPVTWNAEADAKLFLGVLAQLRHVKIKLDTKWLAEYMGDGCTSCAIDNRIVRLRRQVEGLTSEAGTPVTTPKKTPAKRKAPSTPKSAQKRSKGKDINDDGCTEMLPVRKQSEKPDQKVKVEVEVKAESVESDWPETV